MSNQVLSTVTSGFEVLTCDLRFSLIRQLCVARYLPQFRTNQLVRAVSYPKLGSSSCYLFTKVHGVASQKTRNKANSTVGKYINCQPRLSTSLGCRRRTVCPDGSERSQTAVGPINLTPEGGTDRLSQNIGNNLLLLAA